MDRSQLRHNRKGDRPRSEVLSVGVELGHNRELAVLLTKKSIDFHRLGESLELEGGGKGFRNHGDSGARVQDGSGLCCSSIGLKFDNNGVEKGGRLAWMGDIW